MAKKLRLRVNRRLVNLERELKDFPIEFGRKNQIFIKREDHTIKEMNIENLTLKEIKEKIRKELAS